MPDVGQLLVKNDTGRKLQVTLLDNGTAVPGVSVTRQQLFSKFKELMR